MISFSSKYTLATIAGAALFTACAGGGAVLRQPFDGVYPERSRGAQGDKAGDDMPAAGVAKSWMSPDARSHDRLIYVSDSSTYDVYVFLANRDKLVGTLTNQNNPAGLCADKRGDVYVTQLYGHQIVEYAHRGTKPLKTLSDPGYEPGACSVDPLTGNLAVANIVSDGFAQGNLLVYPNATGTPITYSPPGGTSGSWFSVNSVGYDDASNVYLAGSCDSAFCAGVLPKGAATTENVTLNGGSPKSPGTVQWNDYEEAMTFDDQSDGTLYNYKFSGTSGGEVGTVTLPGSAEVDGLWIFSHCSHARVCRNYVIAPQQNGADVFLYSYAGEQAGLFKTFTGLTQPFGSTLSGRVFRASVSGNE
jgi:hypothetical protein